jgi:hypothetical protein
VLPASAVRVEQARPYVLRVTGGKAEERAIALGARGEATFGAAPENAIEVTAGLAPRDVVLRSSVGAVRDGTPVHLLAAAPAASAVR